MPSDLYKSSVSPFLFPTQIFDYTELSQAQVILPVTSTDDHGATVVALVNNGVLQHHPHVSAAAQATNGSNPAVVNTVNTNSNGSNSSTTTGGSSTKSRRTWHEYGRNSEVDKVQIPKM